MTLNHELHHQEALRRLTERHREAREASLRRAALPRSPFSLEWRLPLTRWTLHLTLNRA